MKLTRFILGVGLALICLAYPVATQATTGQIRQELQQILTDTRFEHPDPLLTLKKWLEFSGEHWPKFKLPHYLINTPGVDIFLKKFALGLVVLLPLVLFWLLRKFIRHDTHMHEFFPEPGYSGSSYTSNLNEAKRFAAQGEYRQAVRFLYLATLVYLRSVGSLPESSRASDCENLRTMRRKYGFESPSYQTFEGLVNLFQEKWYGLKSCNESDYQKAHQFCETLTAKFQPDGLTK